MKKIALISLFEMVVELFISFAILLILFNDSSLSLILSYFVFIIRPLKE